MKKLILLSITSLIILVGCSQTTQPDAPLKDLTVEALAKFDGKDGNECYVAVSDDIYLISNSSSWVDGEHLDSEGKASCGRDLTQGIADSPHGISILTTSPKVKLVGKLVS
jgi:predicted heme/steroid binding protein